MTPLRTHAPVIGLLVFLLLAFGGQMLMSSAVERSLMLVPADVTLAWNRLGGGELWLAPFGTLVFHSLLHADLVHLGSNSLFLWIFGALIHELLGGRWFLLLFLLAAIGGGIVQTLLAPASPIPTLGASGAVMGMEGAYLALAVRFRLPDPHVWPISRPVPPTSLVIIAAAGVFFDLSGNMGYGDGDIAYGAHIGGFVTGLLAAALFARRPAAAY